MVEYSNEIIKEKLQELKKKIISEYDLKKMILFGSRARGDHFKTSDVDILIISDKFKDIFFTDRMCQILEYWNLSVDLEPICYTTEEFEKKKKQIGLVRQAVKEGIEI